MIEISNIDELDQTYKIKSFEVYWISCLSITFIVKYFVNVKPLIL